MLIERFELPGAERWPEQRRLRDPVPNTLLAGCGSVATGLRTDFKSVLAYTQGTKGYNPFSPIAAGVGLPWRSRRPQLTGAPKIKPMQATMADFSRCVATCRTTV
jgi:hypothetical protein